MSWADELVKVYELAQESSEIKETEKPLPPSHDTVNAQITVTINHDGTIPGSGFAVIIPNDAQEQRTIIPVTEASGGKRSGIHPPPHPLNDKIKYLAGDYNKYAPKGSDNSWHYNAYMKQLRSWRESRYSTPAIEAIYSYLSRGTLIADLLDCNALKLSSDGELSDKYGEYIVRFAVYFENGDVSQTWKDTELRNKFMGFVAEQEFKTDLCCITGKNMPITYAHPKLYGNVKLFSSNDDKYFSYLGRFIDKTEAFSISYEASQSLHNALKWLIDYNGWAFDSMRVVVWESALKHIKNPVKDQDDDDLFSDDEDYTSVKYNKNLLIKSLLGTENRFAKDSKTMIMALDSATPGRVSMTMYSELATSEYIENLASWHAETMWPRLGKGGVRPRSFSMNDLANCAYGTEQNGKLECKSEMRKELVQRLLPCVSEGRRIPRDIVRTLAAQACRPSCYSEVNWRRVLECACGILRKQIIEEKGECTMALDTECRSRDYLYGRLLAVADHAEASTYDKDNARTTNAKRFFEAFSNRPCQTWSIIYKNLNPYLERMNYKNKIFYTKLINKITDMFEREDFNNNSPLKPEFLHAYSTQLNELYTKKSSDTTDSENDDEEEE